ncbi:MAG: hypothetical protein MUF38_03805 [Anaerolineae bacterium]|jgi:hypothetical protein|nr:hypothetical protein [Anaerolineae bacterium]
MNTHKFSAMISKLFFLWLMIIGTWIISAQTQNDLLFPSEFDRTEGFKWSSDSMFLAFYNYDLGSTSAPLTVNTEAEGWQMVDISTGLLSSGTNLWPFQPILTPDEISLFMPHEFVYTSSDANLLIFGQEPADDIGFRKIALANRDTLQVISLDIRSTANPFNPIDFNVQWGEDNRTATVAFNSFSGTQRIFHIGIPNVHNLQDAVIQEFGVEVNGNAYILAPTAEDKFLDLSTDGRAVLLVARDSTVNGLTTIYDNPAQLLIWRPYTNDVEIVNSDIFIDSAINGSFAPNSSDILFFTTSQGLLVHNIATGTTRYLLDVERINNSNNIFSPDGKWLAIAKANSLEILSLHHLMTEITEYHD